MKRIQRNLYLLASGGVLFGVTQAFGMLNFADIFTQFLAQLFSALVALFVGAAVGVTPAA
jgi:hypothetical protein